MATKKNSIKERAKKVPKKIKDKVKATAKSLIKQEVSFTGSLTEHKDGSIFLFVDVLNDKEGSQSKGLELSKAEVGGLKKFFNFLDLR